MLFRFGFNLPSGLVEQSRKEFLHNYKIMSLTRKVYEI